MFEELNVIRPLLEDPLRKFGVRELAREVSIAPATASTKLEKFRKAGILKLLKDHRLSLYYANMDHPSYRDLKVYYTISKIRKSGLIESFNREYVVPTIILFGSCSTGLDVKESDVDLVIISEKSVQHGTLSIFEK